MAKKFLSLALVLVFCMELTVLSQAYNMGGAGQSNIVSANGVCTAVIDEENNLWMWGNNSAGQLGNGGSGNMSTEHGFHYQTVPVKVLEDVASVCVGYCHTAAIKNDGTLWMWGYSQYGELGNDGEGDMTDANGNTCQGTPIKVMEDVAAVSIGYHYTAAIKTDGTLWMWGVNHHGQLGNGGEGNRTTSKGNVYQTIPVKVLEDVAAVSAGYDHTAAIKTDGSLWTWGKNSLGQLGNGSTDEQAVPVKVLEDVASVSTGYLHTAAVKNDGTLWMWGHSRCETPESSGVEVPTDSAGHPYQTAPVQIMENVAAVSAGANATLILKTDGTLWACGENGDKQLGNGGGGNVTDSDGDVCQTTPVQIAEQVAAVSMGYHHCAAVKADGSVWTWGRGSSGKLGNGLEEDASTPVRLAGLTAKTEAPATPVAPVTPAAPAQSATATPTAANVLVNGEKKAFDAYNINGSNYFKLRDLAYVLSGTEKQFEVGWDNAAKAISLTSGEAYTAVGGEMTGKGSGTQTANPSSAKIILNGKEISLTAYEIGGNNYFKLRDIGETFDFGIGWDNAGKTITIDTSTGYTAE